MTYIYTIYYRFHLKETLKPPMVKYFKEFTQKFSLKGIICSIYKENCYWVLLFYKTGAPPPP